LGYETDSYQLMATGTVCAAGAITTDGLAAHQFAGSDFVKAVLRINVAATSGTYTSWGVVFQSSPDGGTTWYPSFTGAGTGIAVGAAPGGPGVGYYQVGTTCAVGLSQLIIPNLFPGALFRVGLTGLGGTSTTAGITGDFQKFVPDQS
jgi:hypothetical protein